jgi:HSP20 family protein
MTLMRWDPLRELASTRRLMDRWLDDSWALPVGLDAGFDELPGAPVDVVERDNEFEIRATVPGFSPEDIEITVQGEVVTLKGTHVKTEDVNEETYRLRERRVGSFQRTLRLPCALDADNAEASYDKGELTLVVPKRSEAVARRIEVSK